MKNMKKRLISLIIMIMCFGIMPVNAYQKGDVIGYSCYTDIKTVINGYDIPAFNVGGYTYIVVEDLIYYGFSVVWNSYSKTLNVTRNPSVTAVSSSYKSEASDKKLIGQKAHNLLYTDIVTYVNGKYVNSYNINGYTIILFDELVAYGRVSWDAQERKISLTVSGLENKGVSIEELKNYGYNLKKYFNVKDNYSNVYDEVLKLYDISAKYLLNGKYTNFSATFFPNDDTYYTDQVRIYADDKIIYESPSIKYTTKPIYVNLNISGCNEFEIERVGWSGVMNTLEIYMYNATFK